MARPVRAELEFGRPFVHHAFDYLIIGGGLSVLVTLYLVLGGGATAEAFLVANIAPLVLLSNSAHFASSTVRLYTKPGALRSFPVLTAGLPLLAVAVLSVSIAYPSELGRHLMALYLTWSPYHYAAQAYGLALMYCYRSGLELSVAEKRWLRFACLAAFLFAFLNSPLVGLEWFVARPTIMGYPGLDDARAFAVRSLIVLIFVLPIALFLWLQRGTRPRMPLISLLIVLSNGIWWIVLGYMQAFVWATVFHGLQYLAIVTIFHVRDQQKQSAPVRPWWRHTVQFYGLCVGLGFLLFQVWPYFYVLLGATVAQSMLLVTAVINVHHFIVDAYIWRLRKDPNYSVVTAATAAA